MRDRLYTFAVVAEKLNFTQAAQELFMSQPAVSNAIKGLENEYGLPLFSRAGGHVELTEAGLILQTYAKRIRELEQEARKEIHALSNSVQGRLTIGASTTIAQYILPKVIGDFASNYPQVSFALVSEMTDQMARSLSAGKVDVAVVEGETNNLAFSKSVWMSDELQLHTADKVSSVDSITFEELLTLPLLMREEGSGHRQIQEQCFRARGIELAELNIVLELGSTEAIKSAVENGLGYAFLSHWACKKERALKTLKPVSIPKFRITRNFYILQTKESENASLVQRFIGYLNKSASELTLH
jgi:DNA-binding transcriptional LysR family regulator